MSDIYSKTSRHLNSQGNSTHNEENYQIIKTNPELPQTLELAEKDTKAVVIAVFHMFKTLVET